MRALAAWLGARPYWTVSMLGLLLLLAGGAALPLIDRDEPRFAEASREMIQRGDFLVPHFNGDYRFDKPPLIYWCQAAAYAALGESAFAARLPSALFTTGTALLLVAWGRRLGRPQAGFFAGIIYLTCLQALVHGRLAVADMPMVFFFTLAARGGWEMTRPGAQARWAWVFYASLGLGFLAKGPEAWLPLAALGLARWRRPADFRFDPKMAILGFAGSLALVACWGVPALISTHGEFFKVGIGRDVVGRSVNVMQGHGGLGGAGYALFLPYYFVTFFLSFFPWSFVAAKALWDWRKEPAREALDVFLLTNVVVVFAVFTLVATKLPHYTLPAFPCLALWFALQMEKLPGMGRPIGLAATLMAVLAIALACGFGWAGRQMIAANLWRQARPFVRAETRVASVEFTEPSVVWEFRRVATNKIEFIDMQAASNFLAGPGPRCLILPGASWRQWAGAKPEGAVTVGAAGMDTATFKHWDMTAVIKR